MADWSAFLSPEDYVIVFSAKNRSHELFTKILSPFSRNMWAGLLITMFIMQLFLWVQGRRLLCYRNPSHVSALYQVGRIMPTLHNFKIFSNVQVVLKSILEQPALSFPMRRTTLRFVVALWCFFALCITSSYKGNLISMLVKPDINEPSTLEELIQQDYRFQVRYANKSSDESARF